MGCGVHPISQYVSYIYQIRYIVYTRWKGVYPVLWVCRCVCWELDQPPAQRISLGLMWTELKCRQTSVSPAVMLCHVGWCLLLGCLLLDLDGLHVQGQSRRSAKVLPVLSPYTHWLYLFFWFFCTALAECVLCFAHLCIAQNIAMLC